jgi:hypothetical protein
MEGYMSKLTKSIRFSLLSGILLASTTIAACSSLMGGELIREGVATGTLQIINGSGTTVTQVLISECNASSYGMNRMPSGMVLQRGQTWNVPVSAGCYDIMMGYGTATGYAAARQRINVAAGRTVSFRATGR